MSDTKTVSLNLTGLWFLMFVLIKVAGTSLAGWSWLWLLLAIVPDLAFVFGKLGWTL